MIHICLRAFVWLYCLGVWPGRSKLEVQILIMIIVIVTMVRIAITVIIVGQ